LAHPFELAFTLRAARRAAATLEGGLQCTSRHHLAVRAAPTPPMRDVGFGALPDFPRRRS